MSRKPQETLAQRPGLTLQKYGRYWAVYDQGALVVVTVYRKGAVEVIKRLETHEPRSVEPQPLQRTRKGVPHE